MSEARRVRMNRREFVRRTAIGALGAGTVLQSIGTVSAAATPRVVRKGDMVYRRLGRTNLLVSELSVGGSPNPEPAVFTRALDRGMNYVDSSVAYRGSEERIGEVVAGRRQDIVISTKCHTGRMDDPETQVVEACEAALRRINTDYIDIWCVHGVDRPEQFLADGVQAGFAQLKQQGKIRFAGASFHSPMTALPPVIESGALDVALVPFNVFSGTTVRKEDVDAGKVYDNWLADSGLQGVLELAQRNDIGVVAIKTMAGGARQKLDAFRTGDTTLAQAKLKWVLSHEAVASALSEVLSYTILEDNLGAVGRTLTPEDQAMLDAHVRERSASVCRMCGACERACPARVPIRDVLRCITYRDLHGKAAYARAVYREHVGRAAVAACGDCVACARACPHGIDIPGSLHHARRVFV